MFPKLAELNGSEPPSHRISRVSFLHQWLGPPPEVQKNKLQKDIAYHIKQAGWQSSGFFCETETELSWGGSGVSGVSGSHQKLLVGGGNSNILLCSPGTLGT